MDRGWRRLEVIDRCGRCLQTPGVTSDEYRQAADALPFGKRLPGAVYVLGACIDHQFPAVLRITMEELKRRLAIGPEFNLIKFHTNSPRVSFLAYPDFETNPHPALAESILVDLVTGKTRRDDYRRRANASTNMISKALGLVHRGKEGRNRPPQQSHALIPATTNFCYPSLFRPTCIFLTFSPPQAIDIL